MKLPFGLTFPLILCVTSSVLGMFQFGFNSTVVNNSEKVIQSFILLNYKFTQENLDVVWSLIVAIFCIGGLIGAGFGGWVANNYGRKYGLFLNSCSAFIGSILMIISKELLSIGCLIVGRLFIGFNCGLFTVLSPMYSSEVAPKNIRSSLGTLNQLGVTIGLLAGMVLGLPSMMGTSKAWPYLLGFSLFISMTQVVLLYFCPESPRFIYISQVLEAESIAILRKLRGTLDVEEDIQEMQREKLSQENVTKMSIKTLLTNVELRPSLLLGCVMHLSQQLSGITATFAYSKDIFLSANVKESLADIGSIIIGFIMVVMTLISVPLMDKIERKFLHLLGLGGMGINCILITIAFLLKDKYNSASYAALVFVLIFVVFFAIGPGSIPWVITAELFSQGPRPAAMSIVTIFNWFANFSVLMSFKSLKPIFQNYTFAFVPFAFFNFVFLWFIYKKLPKTKGRTYTEITAILNPRR